MNFFKKLFGLEKKEAELDSTKETQPTNNQSEIEEIKEVEEEVDQENLDEEPTEESSNIDDQTQL